MLFRSFPDFVCLHLEQDLMGALMGKCKPPFHGKLANLCRLDKVPVHQYFVSVQRSEERRVGKEWSNAKRTVFNTIVSGLIGAITTGLIWAAVRASQMFYHRRQRQGRARVRSRFPERPAPRCGPVRDDRPDRVPADHYTAPRNEKGLSSPMKPTWPPARSAY